MAVTLTESAARHVKNLLDKRGKGMGLRLGVKKSGCSGFAYRLDIADEIYADDMRFESHGVTLLVQRDSFPVLDGTELDYARQGLNEAFRFNNPNVKDQCGCGESFNV